jgi:hypothetical protein
MLRLSAKLIDALEVSILALIRGLEIRNLQLMFGNCMIMLDKVSLTLVIRFLKCGLEPRNPHSIRSPHLVSLTKLLTKVVVVVLTLLKGSVSLIKHDVECLVRDLQGINVVFLCVDTFAMLVDMALQTVDSIEEDIYPSLQCRVIANVRPTMWHDLLADLLGGLRDKDLSLGNLLADLLGNLLGDLLGDLLGGLLGSLEGALFVDSLVDVLGDQLLEDLLGNRLGDLLGSLQARSICGSRRLRLAVFATTLLWRLLGSGLVLALVMWLFFHPCS